ncbi:zinc-dependent metalloprotease family protein [Corynebacterium mastitidis]|uniref:Zinc-dependent metalloprotease family protein n=1 Tax=Corynebacterium mastitidis TaxID=161890 RepID=A0ABU8NVA1_9CORY
MRGLFSAARSGVASAGASLAALGVMAGAALGVGPAVAAPVSEGPVIDVLVLYPGEVIEDRGGEEAAKVAIEESMALMTDTLNRSGIPGRMNVAQAMRVDAPSGDYANHTEVLSWVRQDAEVQNLRDRYRADLVSYVVPGAAGYAQIPSLPVGPHTQHLAFSVVGNEWLVPREDQPGESGVFAHELGHNLGAQHDWATMPEVFNDRPERHGYASPSGMVDIMGYGNSAICPQSQCERQRYYSNPDLMVKGEPFGQRGGDKPSDLASVFKETMPVVAQYR